MDIKSKLKNPLVQQYVLEIALPLLGYFVFGWHLSVIIAFYFIDFLVSEITRHRRFFAIAKHYNYQTGFTAIMGIALSAIYFIAALTFALLIMLNPDWVMSAEYKTELSGFFAFEGWVLIPIVYLAYHMKDMMTFYMPRKFAKYDYLKTMKNFQVEITLMFVLIMFGLYAWYIFAIPDIWALLGFITVKLVFDFLIAEPLRSKSRA